MIDFYGCTIFASAIPIWFGLQLVPIILNCNGTDYKSAPAGQQKTDFQVPLGRFRGEKIFNV
jgi:hypothetical protein